MLDNNIITNMLSVILRFRGVKITVSNNNHVGSGIFGINKCMGQRAVENCTSWSTDVIVYGTTYKPQITFNVICGTTVCASQQNNITNDTENLTFVNPDGVRSRSASQNLIPPTYAESTCYYSFISRVQST